MLQSVRIEVVVNGHTANRPEEKVARLRGSVTLRAEFFKVSTDLRYDGRNLAYNSRMMVTVDIKVDVFDDPVRNVELLDDLHVQALELIEGFDQFIVLLVGTVAAEDPGEMACEA